MRRRFIQIKGELVEVSRDYVAPGTPRRVDILGDRLYHGLRATDGADISTRTKHQAYMKKNGLTTIDDYTNTFKEAERQRGNAKRGIDSSRKMDIAQTMDRLRNRGR